MTSEGSCAGCETPDECARMGCAEESGSQKAQALLRDFRVAAAARRRRRDSRAALVAQLPTSVNCMLCQGLSLRRKDVFECTACGANLRMQNPGTWLKWITEYEAEEAG